MACKLTPQKPTRSSKSITMCDCPRKEVNDDVTKSPMKTITIFQKCSRLSSQRADWVDEQLDNVKPAYAERKLIVPPGSEAGNCKANIPSLQLSSSNSSDSSERRYEFVNRSELECRCPVGGEGEYEGEGEAEDRSGEGSCTSQDLDDIDEVSDVECTLAIIKPEAVVNRSAIEHRIFEEGFAIEQTRWLQMTSEQVSQFYGNNYGSEDFAHLVAYMSSGPIVVHVLAKKEAVREWRLLMGSTKVTEARMYFPESIRARYGRKGDDYKNAVHGSATREDAQREIHFFFPDFIIEPLLKGQRAEIYLRDVINSVLAKGLTLCCQMKPTDPILWLANWLITNNPNTPKYCSAVEPNTLLNNDVE